MLLGIILFAVLIILFAALILIIIYVLTDNIVTALLVTFVLICIVITAVKTYDSYSTLEDQEYPTLDTTQTTRDTIIKDTSEWDNIQFPDW